MARYVNRIKGFGTIRYLEVLQGIWIKGDDVKPIERLHFPEKLLSFFDQFRSPPFFPKEI